MQLSKKYKASTFSEVIGHKNILSEFIERSKNFNYPEVMFFIGETGSGKTVLATIIAKLINCEKPIKKEDGSYEPCNKCFSCNSVNNETFNRDVHMFNASQMGKESVNKLDDLTSYFPVYDKNTVIIIDEAHELRSLSAKGATKKLLEKKRKNVYFILCTSDDEAFDKEITRRGQVYSFKKVDDSEIQDYLLNIIKKENIMEKIPHTFFSDGIFVISENSYGSPGYALSLLERCINGQLYDEKNILEELGIVSVKKSFDILVKLLKKDISVFEDLSHIDLKEFYNISYKILQETFIYQKSNYADKNWKINNYKRLIDYWDNVYDLIEKFENVRCDSYFRNTSFYFNIINYYNDGVKNNNFIELKERKVKI